MFSYSRTDRKDFKASKVIGGAGMGDTHSYRILYAGPDPADKNRLLIKKVFRTNEHTYFYEDIRLNVKDKTVHSKAHNLFNDMKENLTENEITLRNQYRTHNLLGFSLYWRELGSGKNHMSIIENHSWVPNQSWSLWFKTFFARRDAYNYLKGRWTCH
ncbi:unnamed protein product [Moneuplotes crassus]|uniref:Uncharacterized protein n=2 Tax=Euplotes crassus TaxID=5936 RepID=A0AAD1Y0Q1_EUPCR|nr:unnamed protein product [Moneuplotes crassus]